MTTPATRQPSTGRPGSGDGLPDTFAVSNAVVKVHKDLFGRGPTKARTTINGDTVVCTLDDGLTRSESILLKAGEHDLVRRMREALYDAAREQIVAAVESALGREIVAFCGTVDVTCGVQTAVFTLAR